MKKLNITAALLGTALLSTSAMAVPTAVHDGVIGGVHDLQEVFTNTFGLGRYDVTADQTGAEIFVPHVDGSKMTLRFEENFGLADIFGIYSKQTGMQIEIFSGAATTGPLFPTVTDLTFVGPHVQRLSTDPVYGVPSTMDYLNFGSSFGFYFTDTSVGANGRTVYSESSKNDNVFGTGAQDEDFFLAFRGDGDTMLDNLGTARTFGTSDWIIAGDIATHGDDGTGVQLKDFDDYVVFVSQMEVPAPATLALLGLGLLGMGAAARRKQA